MIATPFKPSVHGWPFVNSFQFAFKLPGLSIPVGSTFGFCGGMVFSALDRFYTRTPIPRGLARPGQGESLYEELLRRQWESFRGGVPAKAYGWQTRRDEDRGRSRGIGYLTSREWPALKAGIDSGRPTPLCLVRVSGYVGNVTKNHQVLAYGYDFDEASGGLTVSIYDPNHPEHADDVRLTLRLGQPGNRIDLRQNTSDDSVRGFFVIPYDRPVPPAS